MNTRRPERPQRAGIYCRLSYAPDGSEEKVDRQEADCRELAQRLRWQLSEPHIFIDNSRSAWQRKRKRPAWDRMLAAVEKGEIDGILVYHGDRLIRQPWDLEVLIGIADSKGMRLASPSGTRNLDSADDRFILRIEAAQACRESDNISRRVRRGIRALKSKGRSRPGGKRPFGWGADTGRTRVKRDRETGEQILVPVLDHDKPVAAEQKLLKEVAKRVLAGLSMRSAVRYMNDHCTSSRGNPWSLTTLTRTLKAPRIAGLIELDGEYIEAVWAGALSVEEWTDLITLLAERATRYPYAGSERVHMLTGIARCDDCNVAVWSKPVNSNTKYRSIIYYCRSCGKGRNERLLDAYVNGRTVRLLNSDAFLKELYAVDDNAREVGVEIATLTQRRASTRAQLENLADFPNLDPRILAASLDSFDKKIRELHDRLPAVAGRRNLARMVGVSREQWEAEPIDVRAETVHALWEIRIKAVPFKGRGFDPKGVLMRRRQLVAADALPPAGTAPPGPMSA